MDKITLHRNENTKNNLFGTLNIYLENGNSANFTTTENPDKAIEKGNYEMFMCYSPRFDTNLWLIDHPNRTGIRIHSANIGSHELNGCIAIGHFRDKKQIHQSRKAIKVLHTILDKYKTYKLEIV